MKMSAWLSMLLSVSLLGVLELTAASPVKRSDDVLPLETVVNTLSQTVQQQAAHITALQNTVNSLQSK
jgi:uncharacterized protein YlxW (UPF0749 family)